jgi:hypothetical protein
LDLIINEISGMEGSDPIPGKALEKNGYGQYLLGLIAE